MKSLDFWNRLPTKKKQNKSIKWINKLKWIKKQCICKTVKIIILNNKNKMYKLIPRTSNKMKIIKIKIKIKMKKNNRLMKFKTILTIKKVY